ncbi:MAG: hypothetical protein K5879_07970 [Lachnospiraceae bacterium]|nr:hypothetical protein [Lachnospiraceae bacterium]
MQTFLLFQFTVPWIIATVILVLMIAATVVLFFLGKKMQKKQAEQDAYLAANKQTVSMLVIDKKKVKFKDAGFPQSVIDQAPKMSRGMKVPVVKAKIGPQIMTFIADEKIFDSIPVKKEVKAIISGMYIQGVKNLHGKVELPPPKKKNIFQKAVDKLQEKAGAKPLK